MPPIIKVVLGFGLVIFLHELGHYLMARRHGVYVEKFAIGFDWPFALLRWTGRTGTEYVLGALPLGGYVKMLGQNELPSELDDPSRQRPDSFQSKTVWQRVQIISAGVIANFLSAFGLCYLAFAVGFHASPPGVGAVGFDSLQAGLRPGDVITELEETPIASWDDLFVTYATLEPGSQARLVVERDGQQRVLAAPVHRVESEPFNRPDFARPLIPRVSSVQVDSAADAAGIEPGDWLVAVDGHPVGSWSAFSDLIRRRADRDVTVTVRREGEGTGPPQDVVLQAHPESRTPDEIPEHTLGVFPIEPPVLDLVLPEGPAARAGLRVGDRVVAVNEAPVHDWYSLWKRVSWELPEGAPLRFRVERPGSAGVSVVDATVTPGAADNWGLGTMGLSTLGIAHREQELLTIRAVPGGAAAQAGLRDGDRLRRFKASVRGDDDWTVEDPSWDTLLYMLNNLEDLAVVLDVERGEERVTVTAQATPRQEAFRIGYLGVSPMLREDLVRLGWVGAVGPALRKPFQILDQFVAGIRAMMLRRVSGRLVSGPVGILRASYTFAEKSTGDLLLFLALLSVNLAVVNFLPIPITDGGHFMFLMYEKWKGRRMDDDLHARFQWAGLVFILLVFLFATFNDVGMILGL